MTGRTARPGPDPQVKRTGTRSEPGPSEPGDANSSVAQRGPSGRVGLLRRLAAVAYDAFLLFALLFVATALLLPFSGGQAISSSNGLYPLYLLAVSYLYFTWCWTHGGQTIGMRAWHIRVRAARGAPVAWKEATVRYLAALLSWAACGAGFLWSAVDRERRTWHDRLSRTTLENAVAGTALSSGGAASTTRRRERSRWG